MSNYIDPRLKLLHHMDRINAIALGAVMPPVNIEIDLSNRCSLGCEWCHFAYTHTRGPLAGSVKFGPELGIKGGDLMDTQLAMSIIDQVRSPIVRSIVWTGGGEPTLHPDFNHIVEYASNKIQQGIYTNGAHLDPDRARLLKVVMEWIYVSLDAAGPVAYKQCKSVDAFDKVMNGISNLVKAPGKATIGVGFLLTEDNWRDLHSMADLGIAAGADYIQFRPTIRPGENTDWIDDCIPELQSIQGIRGVEVDLSRFEMYRDWRGHGYKTCWWSALQAVITPNGKMWTCVNKREFAGAEVGDLSIEPFHLIWSRHKAAMVDQDCRVMCRGHIPNLVLNEIMGPRRHKNFI